MDRANPEMITLARESRGLTQNQLASQTGISQAKISKAEAGLQLLGDSDVLKLAAQLDYPVSFFTQTDSVYGVGSGCLYHRKRKSAPVAATKKLHARLNVTRLRVARLLRAAEISTELRFRDMREEEQFSPVEVAQQARQLWQLPRGPIVNIARTIERAGGIVVQMDFETTKIDAISQWTPGLPPLFFVNAAIPGDRARFSLAHEIGHILLHRYPVAELELEADQFAAEFLMPEEDIKRDLRNISLGKLIQLKTIWKTSMQALLRRAYDLGRIGESYYRKRYTEIGQSGYRKKEPNELPQDTPTVLRALVDAHMADLKFSVEDLARLLHCNPTQLINEYLPEQSHLRLFDEQG